LTVFGCVALFALAPTQLSPTQEFTHGHLSQARAARATALALPVPLFRRDGRPAFGPNNAYSSENWSGYLLLREVTGVNYTQASDTWTVPSVSYAPYSSEPSIEKSASWVGIGAGNGLIGGNDTTLVQLGTEQDVDSSGNTSYYAWYEMLPGDQTKLDNNCPGPSCNYPVSPGDVVTALLYCTANCQANIQQTWVLSISDTTQGWNWTNPQPITYTSSLGSVEWILEATETGGVIDPLTDFSSVTISNAVANFAMPQLSLPADGVLMNDPYGGISSPCTSISGNQFTLVNGDSATCPASPPCQSIGTASELQAVNQNLSGQYCLTQDIDASSISDFTPIGSGTDEFTGVFDGGGHTISGLNITAAYAGLFGYVGATGIVKNVALTLFSVKNTLDSGVLVGENDGTITNVGVIGGSVTGGNAVANVVGGLVGFNYGIVLQSHATVTVDGGFDSNSVGGLVGANGGTISQSYATGAVSQSADSLNVGGLVGANGGTISQSYATGMVGGSNSVGGLVGVNETGSTVLQSYATGTVGGETVVGGLVGWNGGTISQSYATGAVSASSYIGGLVGFSYFGNVSSSYWDTQTTGQTTSAGGSPITDAALKSGLPSGFDPTVWGSNLSINSGYPYLFWQQLPTVTSIAPASGPIAGGTGVAITGTNFAAATAVQFGSLNAASFSINNDSSITATSPAESGTVDVTVTTPSGTSATSSADQFTYLPAPTVTSISPASGPTSGGTGVTITGSNFTGATAVQFGSVNAASFTFDNDSSITATSPAESGTVDVTVTTPSGTSATSSADQFTYQVPTYTINVSASPSAGGTVSGGGTFPAGSMQTVIATANSGYSFTNWTQNASVVSTSASYSFTLNAYTTLVANFTQQTQPVLSVSPANASVAATAGSTSFAVSNMGSGTMSYSAAVISGATWLTITSGGSGGNSGTINVSYLADTGAQRSGTIQITANGAAGSPATVTVTQAAAGTLSLVFGFDLSAYQQYVNGGPPFVGITSWPEAATTTVPYNGQTISFVILRATRGNPAADPTGNCQWEDPLFTTDATAAAQTSLKVGTYHFASIYTDSSQTEDSPEAEADAFVQAAGSWIKVGNMRPFLDLENDSNNNCFGVARMSDPTLLNWVDRWMQEVIKQTASVVPGGVTPIIYTYLPIAGELQRLVASRGYQLWYRPPCAANNPTTCDPGKPFTLSPWTVDLAQYNWYGQILSMAANADIDVFQGDQQAFQSTLIIPNIPNNTKLVATPTAGRAQLAVTFTAAGLTPAMIYTLNFGDGTIGQVNHGSCTAFTASVRGQGGIQCSGAATHTYTSVGIYTATLSNASDSTLAAVTITVTPSPIVRPSHFE
jgi:GH25 family lysozyme M1 (1,4-beta-N-acetylmuramidase)